MDNLSETKISKNKKNNILNPVIIKKLSDYHFSRIVPSFYIELPYNWKYSPYVYSSRIMYTLIGSYIIYRLFFVKCIGVESNTIKKYHYNIYTKPYINYEKALIESEKKKDKIIF